MTSNLLDHLASYICHEREHSFGAAAQICAKHCLLDYLAVTIAGAGEPTVAALRAYGLEQGGVPEATVVGTDAKLPVRLAALVAGAAGHALDFDDNNMAMQGHPSAPLLGGLLPLAEQLGATGQELIDAFIVGYEVQSRIGAGFALDHYYAGFHATATLGIFGVAAAAARLMELPAHQVAHALSIAAAQSSGLKAMFGTMCKISQVGFASEKGVMAAQLARMGITGPQDCFEGSGGFARTHSPSFLPELVVIDPARQLEVEQTIFKFHASCFETHAVAEGISRLMAEHNLDKADISRIDIYAYKEIDNICNIPEPDSGLGLKFSLRGIAAMTVLGVPTAVIGSFSDEVARNERIKAVRDLTSVHLKDGYPQSYAEVELTLRDGRVLKRAHNTAVVTEGLADQEQKLLTKFHGLLDPLLGSDRAAELAATVQSIERHQVTHLVPWLAQSPLKAGAAA